MRAELLNIPDRRMTMLPELVTFFRAHVPTDPDAVLTKFIQVFSGTELKVPGPEVLRTVNRDEEIIKAIEKDGSVARQVAMLLEHSISFGYLQTIWAVCTERRLESAGAGLTTEDRIARAAEWALKHPRLINDIVVMFGISARERPLLHAAIEGTDKAPKRATTKQSPRRRRHAHSGRQ